MIDVKEARDKSIKDYLESRGIEVIQKGHKYFCSSPFAKDTNWSFCVYPNNNYYCWSTGVGGDIINLVQRLEQCSFRAALNHLDNGNFATYKPNYKKIKEDKEYWKNFDYTKYINNNEKEIQETISYGKSRSICHGFNCGVYFDRNSNKLADWTRHPSLMFLHTDLDGNICGAKFRDIVGKKFSSRGKLGFYILENIIEKTYEKPNVFLVESETSANSLWEWFRSTNHSAVVISMGGVSCIPKELPKKYNDYLLKIIIDYDGDEDLYKQRIKQYEHLNAKPVRLILPKNEDINSLYHKNQMYLIENLLLKN